MKVVTIEPTFESWRTYARSLLSEKVHYDNIVWKTSDTGSLFDFMSADYRSTPVQLSIPQKFMQEAAFVAAFSDETTWALLYRLAYRLIYENKHLMSVALDNDVLEFHRRMRLVERDLHKVKAFVRFKEMKKDDKSIYMAWHRPDHRVLKFSAPFFTDRFNGMNWIIFTPNESMSWLDGELNFGPGITQKEASVLDETEDLWKMYYGSIFNPARIKVKAMKKELPVRHWATLPEAEIIDDLLRDAPKRLEEFYESQRTSAVQLIKNDVSSLLELEAAIKDCQACSLCADKPPRSLGMGPEKASVVVVESNTSKRDFLLQTLSALGLSPSDIYFTHATKGHKGKAPSSFEISACRPWLKAQLELIKPKLLICLGQASAQSVFGKLMRTSECSGQVFKTPFCEETIILKENDSNGEDLKNIISSLSYFSRVENQI